MGKRSAPFESNSAPAIGNAFVGLHRKQGVILRLGEEIQAFIGKHAVEAVTLANGERSSGRSCGRRLRVKPVTAYAARYPGENMTMASITVDAMLQAAEGLYAAGDIARFPHHGTPIRVEHWRVAEQQAGPPR